MCRYESGADLTVLAHRGSSAEEVPPGVRISHEADSVEGAVRRTERSARIETAVGAPIVVEGRLWGVVSAGWNSDESPPADTEQRMAQFAQLLDTAIAYADSRDQLTASRARLVTAADEARRRVVRDLHDGAQQRLVHMIVTLKLAQQAFRHEDGKAEALVGEALGHAERSNAELRELAHGILPAVLTRGGLRAAVDAVVLRLDLPVRVDVRAERFPATSRRARTSSSPRRSPTSSSIRAPHAPRSRAPFTTRCCAWRSTTTGSEAPIPTVMGWWG